MKCIDAVEGTAKCILRQLHSTHNHASSDDSEYIHQVKTVIGAIDQYAKKNPDIVNDASILKNVLYVYSRNLWLTGQKSDDASPQPNAENPAPDNNDYQTYYYDYLYERGIYPN